MTSVIEINLTQGETLYRQGDAHDSGFIVVSGEIILYTQIGGKRIDVERRGPGSIVGELSILTGQPRTVTVEAVTDCTFFRISAEQILNRFDRLDPILRACVETSITFTGKLADQSEKESTDKVPLAQSNLRDAEELIDRFRFELDVLRGIENDEFFMVYQPIVAIEDASIIGFEALMRWVHPTRGFVPPDRFIQCAEDMGTVSKLTDYALMETAAALKRMQSIKTAPNTLFASVNISGDDICRPNFADMLLHIIDLNELDPSHIKLEVTETSLIGDFETADRNLKRIRDLGCGISVDDFGTGYSNLAYLKSLPLTTLKIDRAFAGDAFDNAVSRGIVRMLLTLGKELNVDIIAEGLETSDDVQVLHQLGCKYAQGYFYHKPMPEDELTAILSGTASGRDAA